MAVLSSEVWGCLVPSKERKKNFIVDFVGRQHRTLNSASQTSIKMPVKPKVVLAYSGGLDTSVVLKWLSEKVRVYEFVWCFVFFLGERGNVGEWLSLPSRRPAPPPPPTNPGCRVGPDRWTTGRWRTVDVYLDDKVRHWERSD